MTTTAPPSRRHLLPPQATPLERAIDQSAPQWDALAAAIGSPSTGTPDAFAPWLAAEWGLSPFARYFASVDALMAAGKPWLFERGTAASVHRVLGWVGFPDARVDERGALLHINLGRPATAAEIARIAHVVRESVPVHVRFWRVFWGHDRRPLRLDGGQPLETAQLDGSSGVWVSVETGEPVKASFGIRHTGTTTSTAGQPLATATAAYVAKLTRNDKAVLDCWRLDSRLLANEFGGIGELMRGEVPTYVRVQGERGVPGTATQDVTLWSAPPAEPAGTADAMDELPPALPQPQGWSGTWGALRWRPVFIESKSTESN
ncbi:hypothetical protein ASF11_21635 [Acidovorax sp. Leaf76]|uniref:phage tail protein n=1 Tax=unclassified Acidovorax TaxID=2684926 RepID=UPI0006F2CE7A|nr:MULTISPECIES: phage tail protein [unclassified Acidovorax]KQO24190.1 hypothetical protein ASF11_21635 [Acidovorax sp. Leaf76]KQS29212.1 hypothetical protein ASG27_13415 [Acidovorax sp. Leaf191]